jgi:pimeloyl-ACP methyl ester carboxylesterase
MKGINTVVCLHGFWSHGAGMYLIKRRLENEYGMRALLFSYPSVRGTLDDNAEALAEFLDKEAADGAHLLGHSLGGVVSLRMLSNHPEAPPGRLVCRADSRTLPIQRGCGGAGQCVGDWCMLESRSRRDRR